MHDVPIPREVGWIVDLVGEEAALRLVESHGGLRLYVPHQMEESHVLARTVGLDGARRIVEAYAGNQLPIPLVKRWRAQKLRAGGMGQAQIARALGMTEASVQKCLARVRHHGPTAQLCLDIP